MEEGRQRKQELEQAAHQVLPQALRTLLLGPTGGSPISGWALGKRILFGHLYLPCDS